MSGFYANIVNPLKPIRDFLIEQGYKAHICDGYADDNSFPLKAAAIKAGLGWNGKNTLLINDVYGSFQALQTPMGSAFTSYKDGLLDLFSFNRLMAMDEAEYSEYILPHIFGFDLSYEMFKRNVQLAYKLSLTR
ncbi:MAG: hypothetical protein EOM59_05120 [Clostridia bacterium]|nr:hypothetical protein [Clostridia bacterium]